jgi:nitrate reductase gamma subunit
MGRLLIAAAYAVYAAFWIRFLMHGLVWWRATRNLLRSFPSEGARIGSRISALGLTALDVLFLGRVFMVNPALWFGEWLFHASLLLVVLRHLRFFLNPVPTWVWSLQTPGLIAGYVLPLSLVFILVIRFLTRHERYAAPQNMILLVLVLALSLVGLLMQTAFKPDLVDAKLFIVGLMTLAPVAPPPSFWFVVHFGLFLVVVLLLPSHLVTAPLVMYEARKRAGALHRVMHDRKSPLP